jgi:hypothetical protein
MYRLKPIFVATVVFAGGLVAATTAFGFTGPPVVNDQFRPLPDTHPQMWCGQVEGTSVDKVAEHYIQDANGSIIDNVRITSLFTAKATGKAILSSGSSTTKSTGPTDNGDGTVSFISHIAGLTLKFQIPGGPVLKATNGEPIRSAGSLTVEDIFDAATGDYITTNETFNGPHLLREGVDICGPSVAYLLDP